MLSSVISALTNSANPRDYWYKLKIRMSDQEKSELSTFCRQLKMKAKDGKIRETDVLDTEGIFRLIESVSSPKAEPFKMWLAKLGRQEVDNVFDPSKGIDKMIDYYLSKGYSLEWIETIIKAIIDRKRLVNIWRENGITDLGEIATRELARKYKPDGFDENRKIAKEGGEVAKIARDDLEKNLENLL